MSVIADILHDFPIAQPIERVWAGFTEPGLLDQWWTLRSSGVPKTSETYQLYFGPKYDWRARVMAAVPFERFQLMFTEAAPDWIGTRYQVLLEPTAGGTQVRFSHTGWAEPGEHYRTSSYCWAMYLRILRRHLEHGETVPYDQRLSV